MDRNILEVFDIINIIKSDISKIITVTDSKIKQSLEQNINILEEKLNNVNYKSLEKLDNITILQEKNIKYSEQLTKKLDGMFENKRTFSQVVSASKSDKSPQETIKTYPIIIKSKTSMKPEEMKTIIKKNINVTKLKIGINTFKKIGEDKIIISCPRKQDTEKLTEEINKKLGESFSTEEMKKKKPFLIIKRLQCNIKEDDLIDALINQNWELDAVDQRHKDEIKLIKELKSLTKDGKQREFTNYIIQTSGAVRKILLSIGKININYQKVTIEDCNPLVQCYHCLKYGHTAQRCLNRAEPTTCPQCSEEHTLDACNSKHKEPKCKNCVTQNLKLNKKYNTDHRADSHNCQYREIMLQLAKQRIEYD